MPLELSATASSAGVAAIKQRLSGFDTEEGRLKGLSFKPQPDDYFVVTTPKAGTTWMQHICHQLRTNGDMTFDEISAVVPWIELAADLGQTLDTPQVALPRVFKTHCWYDNCPKGGRYIVVVRDPADVAVSFFKFFRGWFFQPGEVELEEFVREFWLCRGLPATHMQNAGYFHHVLSWWQHRLDDNVLWVFFEDMLADLPGTVRRVQKFMRLDQLPDAEARFETAVAHSSFDFMQSHPSHFDEHITKHLRNAACGLPPEAGRESSKINTGAAGRGKLHLSEELLKEIADKWQQVVGSATGYASYAELRKGVAEELKAAGRW